MATLAFLCLLLPFSSSLSTADYDYTSIRTLGVRGWAFPDKTGWFSRLPSEAESIVRDAIWILAQDTAGFYVEFVTDSPTIMLNFTLLSSETEMYHFPSTGVSGSDLYRYDNDAKAWRWVGTTHEIAGYPKINTEIIASDLPQGTSQYRLHLPLYNGIIDMDVGVSRGKFLQSRPTTSKPIVVWYGTSIAQGAVASRPGQAFTNILSRKLDYEIYNFGFSGNGVMEISVAQFLRKIDNVDAFVIDCLPNMNASMVQERTVPLVKYIRETYPDIPIVLAEGTSYGEAWISPNVANLQEDRRKKLHTAYELLRYQGDTNLHYVYGDNLLHINTDYVNPTVAGTHPTDLGMYDMADYYKKFLPTIIKPTRHVIKNNDEIYISAKELNKQHGSPRAPISSFLRNYSTLNLTFTDVIDLGIRGRGFSNTPIPYNRLPSDAKGVVRDQVWSLGLMSTGLFVEFDSNATGFYLNYSLSSPAESLWHMPLTGTSGCDLFTYDVNVSTWRFVATVAPLTNGFISSSGWLIEDIGPVESRKYRLYFPMRATIVNASIGIPSSSFIRRSSTDDASQPIVWYGTSITQAGAVARAGSTFTNVIGRNLGRDVINLGFAGNGKMELDVAKFLVRIDAAMFVIDCNPNLNGEEVAQRAEPLVKFIRQSHETTPIVLAEGSTYGDSWLKTGTYKIQEAKRVALQKAYENLKADGIDNLHYVKGDDLFAARPLVNPTVGGTHPSDLGHREIAEFYTKFLPPILNAAEK